MKQTIATVALVVRDYDEAIAFYRGKLGFELVADTDMGGGKRWVVVSPPGGNGARLLLAQASGDEQLAAVGNQTGGRVAFFLETDDFARDFKAFTAAGVRPRGTAARGLWQRGGVRGSLRHQVGPDRAQGLTVVTGVQLGGSEAFVGRAGFEAQGVDDGLGQG